MSRTWDLRALCNLSDSPLAGATTAATSVWGLVKETAAAVWAVTTWRPEPVWSAPSAKMVSCQLSYLHSVRLRIKGSLEQNLVQMAKRNAWRCSFYLWTRSQNCSEWLKMIPKTDVLSSPLEFFSIFLKASTNSWSRRAARPCFVLLSLCRMA